MRLIGYLLTACIILALLKAALAVLIVAAAVALVWGILFRPAQVFGFIGLCVIAALIREHPWAFVALVAIGALIGR